MKYKPELGFFGNLERAYSELDKINVSVRKTKLEQDDTNALTLELAADHEERLCMMELGI